jgi:hypothetical protein
VKQLVPITILLLLCSCASIHAVDPRSSVATGEAQLNIGTYAVGLSVKRSRASRGPFVKLGLRSTGDRPAPGESIDVTIIQRMLGQNVVRLDPGWHPTGGSWRECDQALDAQSTQGWVAVASGGAVSGTKGVRPLDPDQIPTAQPALSRREP